MNLLHVIVKNFIWKQGTTHQFFQKSLSIGTETSNVITAKPGGRVNDQIQLINTSNKPSLAKTP